MRFAELRADRPAGAFIAFRDFAVDGVGGRPLVLRKIRARAGECDSMFLGIKLRAARCVHAHIVQHKISMQRAAGATGIERLVRQRFDFNASDFLNFRGEFQRVLGLGGTGFRHQKGAVFLWLELHALRPFHRGHRQRVECFRIRHALFQRRPQLFFQFRQ